MAKKQLGAKKVAKKQSGVKKATKKAGKKSSKSPDKCTKNCSVVMVLTIQRIKEWPKRPKAKNKNTQDGGTIAKFNLKINGKVKLKGYMLEAAGPSTTVAGTDQRIMPGSYRLIKNPGTKGPYRLVNGPFGKRSLVNIHAGNYPTDLEGCFAPGTSWSEQGTKKERYPFVGSSSAKLNKLKALINKNAEYKGKKKSTDGKHTYSAKYISNLTVIVKEIVAKKAATTKAASPKTKTGAKSSAKSKSKSKPKS